MAIDKHCKWLGSWLAFSAFFLSIGAAAADLMEGVDYRILNPPLSRPAGNKVEVIEFFWYNCPHCNAMAPLIEPWARRNRQRILFKRVPYARSEQWRAQQQLYYTLQAMGMVEKLHSKIFQAIHEQKIPLQTAEQMAQFVQRHGVDPKRFLALFNAPAVLREISHADQLAAQAGVEKVPSIVVAGRYITYAALMGGSNEDVLAIADRLVDKVHQHTR